LPEAEPTGGHSAGLIADAIRAEHDLIEKAQAVIHAAEADIRDAGERINQARALPTSDSPAASRQTELADVSTVSTPLTSTPVEVNPLPADTPVVAPATSVVAEVPAADAVTPVV